MRQNKIEEGTQEQRVVKEGRRRILMQTSMKKGIKLPDNQYLANTLKGVLQWSYNLLARKAEGLILKDRLHPLHKSFLLMALSHFREQKFQKIRHHLNARWSFKKREKFLLRKNSLT